MGNPTSATALPGDLAVSRAMTAPWALFWTSDVFLTLCIGLHLLLPSLVYAR